MEQQISFLDLLSGKTFQEPLAVTKDATSKQSSKRSVTSGGGQGHIVPLPPKGKWLPAGCIVGDGWSVAWRVYDAQFWGVPQRRKRIYLIADFASERAGEILFECESVHGDSAESGEAREGTAADAQRSVGRSDCVRCLNPWDAQSIRQFDANGCWPSLQAYSNGGQNRCGVCYAVEGNTVDRTSNKNGKGYCEDVSPTLNTQDKHAVTYAIEGNGQRESHQGDGYAETDTMYTLNTIERHAVCFQCCGDRKDPSVSVNDKAYCLPANPMSDRQHAVCYPDKARSLCARADSSPCVDRGQNFICVQNTGRWWWNEGEVAETLRTPCGGDSTKANLVVSYGVDCRNAALDKEKTHTIQAKANGGISLNCTPSVLYDARGNGGGMTAPTITGDHQNRVSDYTCICVERLNHD